MKKMFAIIAILLLLVTQSVYAANIEVQPTMQSRTNAQDRVWVGTFQLVWNDFMDKIVHNPVRFREGTPTMASELNMQTFKADDISDKCYYKTVGKITKSTKKQIATAIKKKFNEKSDILNQLNLTPANNRYIVYAMLKKDFEFVAPFDKLGKSRYGNSQTAEYFGVNSRSKNEIRSNIKVLFYNSSDDFALSLATKSNDEVFIYKTPTNKAFNYIYEDMLKKETSYNGSSVFSSQDELKIPNISFFEEKEFNELTGKRIMGTNMMIDKAIETVKFDMDNKGVKLKSEAAVTTMMTSLRPDIEKRYFLVDDTFVIFLKEKGKSTPYFALRVNDISKFQ
jgi:ribosomal protein L23